MPKKRRVLRFNRKKTGSFNLSKSPERIHEEKDQIHTYIRHPY